MEINKQIFEDVLSGKLKGTFVLRNGTQLDSSLLKHNKHFVDRRYGFECNNDYNYYDNGLSYIIGAREFDIIDFIPDTDTKENELTIEIPDGKMVDWEESKKQNKIVLKKKDTKPRSWEEYCTNTKRNRTYFIGPTSGIIEAFCGNEFLDTKSDKNTLPSKELAEAFLAMMQLMSLRQAWIGDWKPDWLDMTLEKRCIIIKGDGRIVVNSLFHNRRTLSFPTEEMAEDFMNCFEDLLEVAKPLI